MNPIISKDFNVGEILVSMVTRIIYFLVCNTKLLRVLDIVKSAFNMQAGIIDE